MLKIEILLTYIIYMMKYGSPEIFKNVQRLDWNKLPQINYYGKKIRGKRRPDADDLHEDRDSSSSPKSGKYYGGDSPLAKAGTSVITSYIQPDLKQPAKEMKSLGIQAILLRSSHHKRDGYEPSESEVSHIRKKKKKMLRIIRRVVEGDTQTKEDSKNLKSSQNQLIKVIPKNRSISVADSSSSQINKNFDKSLSMIRANNIMSTLENHNQSYEYPKYSKRQIPESSESEINSLYRKKSVDLPQLNSRLRKNIQILNPITGDSRSQFSISQKKHYVNDYSIIDVGRVHSKSKNEHIFNF